MSTTRKFGKVSQSSTNQIIGVPSLLGQRPMVITTPTKTKIDHLHALKSFDSSNVAQDTSYRCPTPNSSRNSNFGPSIPDLNNISDNNGNRNEDFDENNNTNNSQKIAQKSPQKTPQKIVSNTQADPLLTPTRKSKFPSQQEDEDKFDLDVETPPSASSPLRRTTTPNRFSTTPINSNANTPNKSRLSTAPPQSTNKRSTISGINLDSSNLPSSILNSANAVSASKNRSTVFNIQNTPNSAPKRLTSTATASETIDNIKTFIRIRPEAPTAVLIGTETKKTTDGRFAMSFCHVQALGTPTKQAKAFLFDKVLDRDLSQGELYQDVVEEDINKLFETRNGQSLIFMSYGQVCFGLFHLL